LTAAEGQGAQFDFRRMTSRALGAIANNFVPFVGLSLIFVAAPFIAYLLAEPASLGHFRALSSIPGLVAELLSFVSGLLFQAVVARAVIGDLCAKPVSIPTVLGAAPALLPQLIGIGLLIVLVTELAFAAMTWINHSVYQLGGFGSPNGTIVIVVWACIALAMVFLLSRWWVSIPALAEEGLGVVDAMARSADLTKTHPWVTLGIVGMYILVWAVGVLAIFPIRNLLLVESGPNWFAVVVTLGSIHALLAMIANVGIAAAYFELRQIKDGFGLLTWQQAVNEIGLLGTNITSDELRNIVRRTSIARFDGRATTFTALYEGAFVTNGDKIYTSQMAQDLVAANPNGAIVDNTHAGHLLKQPAFQKALAVIFPLSDSDKLAFVYRSRAEGVPGVFDEISKRFAAHIAGDVITMTPTASPAGTFAATVVPAWLHNRHDGKINGVAKSFYRRAFGGAWGLGMIGAKAYAVIAEAINAKSREVWMGAKYYVMPADPSRVPGGDKPPPRESFGKRTGVPTSTARNRVADL
jgi:hypothetical protein